VDGRSAGRWRSGLNTRNTLLVVAILGIQLGFIASYLGAFHNPRPARGCRWPVVAPAGTPPEQARQAVDRLNAIAGTPAGRPTWYRMRTPPRDELAGAEGLRRLPAVRAGTRPAVSWTARRVSSLSEALGEVFAPIAHADHHELTVVDVIPGPVPANAPRPVRLLPRGGLDARRVPGGHRPVDQPQRPGRPTRPAAVVRLGAVALYAGRLRIPRRASSR